jgi:hydrogenase/urease accessory protein HupE
MVNNLPMILSLLRTWSLILLCLLTTAYAYAHPGHEGHEGDDGFTWTSEHLTRHPFATALCATIVVLSLWLAFRHFRGKQRQSTVAVIRSQAAGRNS